MYDYPQALFGISTMMWMYAAKTYHPLWSRSNIPHVPFFVFLFLWRCNDVYCIYCISIYYIHISYIYIIFTYHIYICIYTYMAFKDKGRLSPKQNVVLSCPTHLDQPWFGSLGFPKRSSGASCKKPQAHYHHVFFMRKNAVML